jgi:hypothetical protein
MHGTSLPKFRVQPIKPELMTWDREVLSLPLHI